MNLLGSLIPPQYTMIARIGLYAILAISLVLFGWVKGIEHEQTKYLKDTIKDQQTVIKIHDTQTIIDTKAVNDLQSKLKNVGKQNDELKSKIKNLTDNCNLSADWLRIYNDSTKVHDAGSTSGSNATSGRSEKPSN